MIDSVMADLSVDNVENGGNAATAGQRTVFYNNDPLNRTSMIDNGTSTVYGPPSGVNQYTSVSGHTLAYDANFNLSGYDAWSYVYDADKRLISASGSGTAMGQGHSAQFVYDGLGRCVKRTIDNVTTLITYDGWKPVAEWNGAGGLVAWNLYGPGADEILVRYDVGATKHVYYHLDALGHVQFLLDGNGDVLDKYTYDAFGKPKIMDGNGVERTTTSNGNRFLFTGREYLSALGLYDYRHRVYHPGLGRFMQVDPMGLHIEGAKLSAQQTALYAGGAAPGTFASSEFNLYRYCHSDPVNHNDPSGLIDDGAWDGGNLNNVSGGEGGDQFGEMAHRYIVGPIVHDVRTAIDMVRNNPVGSLAQGISAVSRGRINVGATSKLPVPKVTDGKLKNIVRDLYRGAIHSPNPIGTGSTADALRNETATGLPTGGRFHLKKATDYLRGLTKWMQRHPNANDRDKMVAETLKRDLEDAKRAARGR
jgi:RHS repeat-associated protein